MSEICIKQEVQVTSGMRGIFPVLIGYYMDEETGDKWSEPIQTGFTHKTRRLAWIEAHEWAMSEDLQCVCPECRKE